MKTKLINFIIDQQTAMKFKEKINSDYKYSSQTHFFQIMVNNYLKETEK